MATKPTSTPGWNSSGTNNVAPSSGRKSAGFATGGDVPASGELNWLFKLLSDWAQYLSDGLFTTTGTGTAVSGSGGFVGLSGTGAQQGVVGTGTSGSQGVGVKGSGAGAGAGGEFHPGGSTGTAIVSAGNIDLSTASNVTTPAAKNAITPSNVPKAWFSMALTISGGGPTLNDSFNSGGVSVSGIGSSAVLVCTFATPFANANYAVTCAMGDEGGALPPISMRIASRSTSQVAFRFRGQDGSVIDPSTGAGILAGVSVVVTCIGNQ